MSAADDFNRAYAAHHDDDPQIPELTAPAVAALLEAMRGWGVVEIEIDIPGALDPYDRYVVAYHCGDDDWIDDSKDQGALGQQVYEAITGNNWIASIPREILTERPSRGRPDAGLRVSRDELQAEI